MELDEITGYGQACIQLMQLSTQGHQPPLRLCCIIDERITAQAQV